MSALAFNSPRGDASALLLIRSRTRSPRWGSVIAFMVLPEPHAMAEYFTSTDPLSPKAIDDMQVGALVLRVPIFWATAFGTSNETASAVVSNVRFMVR